MKGRRGEEKKADIPTEDVIVLIEEVEEDGEEGEPACVCSASWLANEDGSAENEAEEAEDVLLLLLLLCAADC